MALRTIAILSLLASPAFGYPKIGEYMPVSNVQEHMQISKDTALMVAALKGDEPDYALAKHIYTKGGGESCKSADKARTLQGFATKDLTGESYADNWYQNGYSKTWWDDWFLAGLDGTGPWAKLGVTQRSVSLQKGLMGLMSWYAAHELEAAIVKAKKEETRTDAKAGHAWDEGWAFYYGATDGTSAPWEVAKKRDADFPDGVAVKDEIVGYFNGGLVAVRKDTYDEEVATTHMNVIYKMWAITYLRAALKYLQVAEKAYGNGKAHAEGYAYWMATAGMMKESCPDGFKALTDGLEITQTSIPSGTYCAAKAKIEACFDKWELSCKMVGEYKDAKEKGIECPDACKSKDYEFPKGVAAVAAVDEELPADVKCKPPAPGAPAPAGGSPAPAGGSPAPAGGSPAPAGGDASSAMVSTVGLTALGVGLLLQM